MDRMRLSWFTCVAIVGMATPANGQVAIYTFDPPNFFNGQTTPILNAPPNLNPGPLTTSFTSSPLQARGWPGANVSASRSFRKRLPSLVVDRKVNCLGTTANSGAKFRRG